MIAKRLQDNLESVMIIDLVAVALHLWNKLCPVHQRIELKFCANSHSVQDRNEFVQINQYLLKTHYHTLSNPNVPPRDIREFLIKIHWIAYYQAEGIEPYPTKYYLNWDKFINWLNYIRI